MATQFETSSVPVASTDPDTLRMGRRAVVSGSIGSALEWFDFAVYGALSATVFPVLFFPGLDPVAALLASFATFGVGFVARPLGGVFFGYLGDKIGRRPILVITLVGMGVASTLVGLLPGYASIGLAAPLLLVALRFLQGFALGGEVTGSQLLAIEHAPPGRRGVYGAVMAMMGSPASQVVAGLFLTGLSVALTGDQFRQWGWRIPFLASLALLAIGYLIRRQVAETPVFVAANADPVQERPRALAVLRTHPGTVVALLCAYAPVGAIYYITVIFGISYMTRTLGFTTSTTFAIVLIAHVVSIFAGVGGGALSERIGRRRAYCIGLGALLVFVVPLFAVIQTRNVVLCGLAITLVICAVHFLAALQPSYFGEAFPTAVRFTGSALSYTGANVIFSAPAPFVAGWLVQTFNGSTIAITVYGIVTILISAVALRFLPDRSKKSLRD
jgi:MFS family permease